MEPKQVNPRKVFSKALFLLNLDQHEIVRIKGALRSFSCKQSHPCLTIFVQIYGIPTNFDCSKNHPDRYTSRIQSSLGFSSVIPTFFLGHVAQASNQSSTRHASLRLNMVHLSFGYWTGDLILEQRARPNMGTDQAALINSGQSEMFAAVHLMFYVPQLQL